MQVDSSILVIKTAVLPVGVVSQFSEQGKAVGRISFACQIIDRNLWNIAGGIYGKRRFIEHTDGNLGGEHSHQPGVFSFADDEAGVYIGLEHQGFQIAYIRWKRYVAIALIDLCDLCEVQLW